jgi:hypothetical protein
LPARPRCVENVDLDAIVLFDTVKRPATQSEQVRQP